MLKLAKRFRQPEVSNEVTLPLARGFNCIENCLKTREEFA